MRLVQSPVIISPYAAVLEFDPEQFSEHQDRTLFLPDVMPPELRRAHTNHLITDQYTCLHPRNGSLCVSLFVRNPPTQVHFVTRDTPVILE
jgi:hypothetical protein